MTTTRNERGEASPAVLIIGGIVLLALVVVAVFGIQWVTAEPRGKLDQRERTVANGQYRIANYDSFFNLCGSIQAKEDQIRNTEDRPTDNKNGTAGGFTESQKQSILLALENSRASLIRQYNADATKEGTAGQFRDSNLPYQINVNDKDTTCAA